MDIGGSTAGSIILSELKLYELPKERIKFVVEKENVRKENSNLLGSKVPRDGKLNF